MTIIHDENGNGITEFPEVSSKRVMPTKVQESALPTDASTESKQDDILDNQDDILTSLTSLLTELEAKLEPLGIVKGRGYGYNGTNWHEAKIDESTRAAIAIDYVHHEIHDGCHFYMEGHTTLANLGVFRVRLDTPPTKLMHLQWAISSSGILETTLHEAPIGGMAGGTTITPLNNDRNSSSVSGARLTSGITAAGSNGTLISNAKWGAAGFKSTVGGGSSREDELIMKQDTAYLRTFTSGADNNIVQFKAGWYEHTTLEA